jgi:hypothetical protein
MSTTGPDIVERAYRRLGDDSADPVVSYYAIKDLVNQCVRDIASPMRLGVGPVWLNSILTTTLSSRDYTLPTTVGGVASVEYEQIISVRYSKSFLPLRKISRDELDARRALGASASGRQADYCLWPGPDQVVNFQFPGFPTFVEDLDAFCSLVPSDWPDGPGAAPIIPFSKRAQDALVLMVVGKAGQTMGQDKLESLRIDKDSVAGWLSDAATILTEERMRVVSLKLTHGPRNFAWVAGWVL